MRVQITRVSTCKGTKSKIKPTEFCLLVETKIYGDDVHIESEWYTETDDIGELIEWLAEKEDQAIIYVKPEEGGLPAGISIYDAHLE